MKLASLIPGIIDLKPIIFSPLKYSIIKSKITEVNRQLALKEEEIISVKKTCKQEKLAVQQENKKLLNKITALNEKIDEIEKKHALLKQEFEESPVSILRVRFVCM